MDKNPNNIFKKSSRLARKLSVSHLIVFMALFAGIAVARQLFTLAATTPTAELWAQCDQITPSKTVVTTGTTFNATVKMTNKGTTPWSRNFGTYLRDYNYNRWNFSGNLLPVVIYKNTSIIFPLQLHAPATPGVYGFRAGMYNYTVSGGWIPNICPNVNITVKAPPVPPCPAGQIGTYPNCRPDVCPAGQIGTPPNCTTPGCPAGQTGTPPNCTTPTGGGGAPPIQGSSNRNTGTAPAADTSPPTAPADFKAKANTSNMSAQLSWTASTDNIGVQSYQLERSLDNVNNWESLSGSITETNFEDFSVSFGVHYYYRLKAIDAAGNASAYASTEIVSSGFEANAHPDSDTTITSEDGLASIFIPSGALEKDAFCSIVVAKDILSPIPKGYLMLGGPYEFKCRDESDTNLTFKNAPVLTGQINKQMVKGIGKVEYFGQAEGDTWKTLKISKHNKKTLADTVELDNHSVFTIMGKHKKTSIWLIIFEIFLVLAGLVVLARFVVSWLLKRKAQKQYDETLHKSRGW